MSFLKADVDSAHVKFPPPLIALLNILFGTLLNWFWPAPIVSESLRWPLGALLILGGVGILVSCSRLFKKAQTNIAPSKTTSHIVTTGIYGLFRNPIYIYFVIVLVVIVISIIFFWIVFMLFLLLNLHRQCIYLQVKN